MIKMCQFKYILVEHLFSSIAMCIILLKDSIGLPTPRWSIAEGKPHVPISLTGAVDSNFRISGFVKCTINPQLQNWKLAEKNNQTKANKQKTLKSWFADLTNTNIKYFTVKCRKTVATTATFVCYLLNLLQFIHVLFRHRQTWVSPEGVIGLIPWDSGLTVFSRSSKLFSFWCIFYWRFIVTEIPMWITILSFSTVLILRSFMC